METRQRSLSVGNDDLCWKNRHLQQLKTSQQQQQQQHHLHAQQQQPPNHALQQLHIGSDMIDGVQLRRHHHGLKSSSASSPNRASGGAAFKRNSAECWKSALNRNDLISIIRESMEKNRLCFQMNG